MGPSGADRPCGRASRGCLPCRSSHPLPGRRRSGAEPQASRLADFRRHAVPRVSSPLALRLGVLSDHPFTRFPV